MSQKLRILAATAALTAAPVLALAAPQAAQAATNNCPSGAVCIYAGTTTSSAIQHAYFSRGAHHIENPAEFGNHLVLNNQTGGWTARVSKNGDGSGTLASLSYPGNRDGSPSQKVVNLTEANYVTLYSAGTCYPRCQ